MFGKRVDLVDGKLALDIGEYGKDADGVWWAVPPAPGFSMGKLTLHEVTENPDGTITVSPSILSEGHNGRVWHGYLQNGRWTEA